MKRSKRLAWGLGLIGAVLLGAIALRGQLKRAARETLRLVRASQEPRKAKPLVVAETIYAGKLSEGWSDWGWGQHRLGNGPAQVVFASYGGIVLHHGHTTQSYGAFSFRYRAPDWGGEFLQVSLRGSQGGDVFPKTDIETYHVALLPDGWREVLLDWEDLNPRGLPFESIVIGASREVASDWVSLDQVILTRPEQKVLADRQDILQILCGGPTHPISPLIYGSSSEVWASGHSAQRLGGNPLSRFHWELGVWNTGADWFFENAKQPQNLFQMVDTRAKADHPLALVVPMLGWVSKDDSSFGFPRSLFKEQRKFDPHKPDAGDGAAPDGTPLPPGAPEQTSVPAPPELIEQWVRRLVSESEQRGGKGVQIYILDNEPSLWNTTHRDVRPKPLSYDELLERSIKYARAIRQADAKAVIAGPAEWGWLGYQYSAVDREAGYSSAPDKRAHGNVWLVPWYLKKLADYEKTNQVRLLDMLDLHFYPAGEGVFSGGEATDPKTAALRIRSTRALWDPGYHDESWIKEPIRLIPRMKDWVRQNYPGLKLSIGEWNFGAEGHISGGIATAEALGRFGQQGLDAAFHWGDLKLDTPAYWAFRAFRNYDGAGARFLDVSVPVRDSGEVSLFASRDEASGRMVVVMVNRDPSTRIKANVELSGCKPVTDSRFFTYTGQALAPARATVAGSSVLASLDPYSISVLELTTGAAPRP
ncbi:MAG TPA: glycoside hydrolase family 44 protein [Polyangiaceae bacterium]|nr:glycoside hydrolase family 44 protein [Polyangiaceae bacterium]